MSGRERDLAAEQLELGLEVIQYPGFRGDKEAKRGIECPTLKVCLGGRQRAVCPQSPRQGQPPPSPDATRDDRDPRRDR